MRLRFKVQRYQTAAVDAVADCFDGQPRWPRADHGANAEIALSPAELLANIQAVQRGRGLPLSAALAQSRRPPHRARPTSTSRWRRAPARPTSTSRRSWSCTSATAGRSTSSSCRASRSARACKKSFDDHRRALPAGLRHASRARSSTTPRGCTSWSGSRSDAGVQVMIINIQAFNATGKDSRRIYEVLDDFQSRRPIDVISANRPIVIIDEPQKIGDATKSLEALARFNAAVGAALLGHPQGRAQQGPPARRARRLQPEAGQEDRGARHHRQGPGRQHRLPLPRRDRGRQGRQSPGARRAGGADRGRRSGGRSSGSSQGANLHDVSGGIEAYRGLRHPDVDANRDVDRAEQRRRHRRRPGHRRT